MLTARWKALLYVAWRGNQLSMDGALFRVTQPSGSIAGWDPSGAPFPGPRCWLTFFGRACPPFPEKQAASQEPSQELRRLGVPQLGSPQIRMPTLLESLACLGG